MKTPNLALTNVLGWSGLGWCVIAGVALAACTSGPPTGPIAGDRSEPTRVEVVADWDDVYSAAVVAANKSETAVLEARSPTPDEMVIEMTSIRDEPVQVVARRIGPAESAEGAVPIELTCRYGLFGDAHMQRRVLDAMARRLEDLKGVYYRRVR